MNVFRILVLLICINSSVLYSQHPYSLPQVTPHSPNVSSIEKYGNIPVSLSTGLPKISIPLTSVNVSGLNLPIVLNYHNAGLKVDAIPSMMGLGWDLEFGGMISFQQRGLNDFDQQFGGMQYSFANMRNYLNGTMNVQQKYDYLEMILREEQDSEFDVYNFNLMGQTGMFFFDTSGKAIISPKSDMKIFKTAGGLRILDNSGNEFIFEEAEGASSIESTTVFVSPSFNGTSAWHLSKIITQNGRIVQFKYKKYTLHYSKTVELITHTQNPFAGCPGSSIDYADYMIQQEFLLPDSIIFDQGYIKFILSNEPRQDLLIAPLQDSIPSLSGFYVVNNKGKKITEFSFTQSYFDQNARLKLGSVEEKINAEISRKWTLGYIGEAASFPTIFSEARDHWGFYNGATSNQTLIPDADYREILGSWQNYLGGVYADRTSNYNFAKLGLLSSITYPTGGATFLSYEPQQIRISQYSDIVQYPFLKWPSNSIPTQTQVVASKNTLYGGSATGSFTLAQTTPVHMTAFIENDPASLNSPRIEFTGPQDGIGKLYNLVYSNCNVNSCQGFGDIVLEAGTYTYSLYQGSNENLGTTLHCNFEITTQVLDTSGALPPFEAGGVRIASLTSVDSIGVNRSLTTRYVYDDTLSHVVFRNIPNYIISNQVSKAEGNVCIDCGMVFKVHSESVTPFTGNNIEYHHVTELIDTAGTGGKIEHYFLSSSNEGGNNTQPYVAPVNTFWRAGLPDSVEIYKYENGNYSLVQQTRYSYFISNKQKLTNGLKVDYAVFCQNNSPINITHRTGLSTLFTEQVYQNQIIKKEYLNNILTNTTNVISESNSHTAHTQTESFSSKGQSVKEKIKYSFDYDTSVAIVSPNAAAIKSLLRRNILTPIEKLQVKKINNVEYVTGGLINIFRADRPVISKIYSLKISVPVPYNSFVASFIDASGNFIMDSRYEERAAVTRYDEFNNAMEDVKVGQTPNTHLWDYKKTYLIADIRNSDSASSAYTSFEADGTGNWQIAGSGRDNSQGLTGRSSYELSNGNIVKTGLSTTQTYWVTYWSRSGSAIVVAGTQGSPITGRTANGWTCFKHKVTGVAQVTLSGTGLIDELRLHPMDAEMTTYTYEPLLGISSTADVDNHTTYYEYDHFGRLKLIRDMDGNIVKTYDYHYKTGQQ
jgi:YD repeat-containing protein